MTQKTLRLCTTALLYTVLYLCKYTHATRILLADLHLCKYTHWHSCEFGWQAPTSAPTPSLTQVHMTLRVHLLQRIDFSLILSLRICMYVCMYVHMLRMWSCCMQLDHGLYSAGDVQKSNHRLQFSNMHALGAYMRVYECMRVCGAWMQPMSCMMCCYLQPCVWSVCN
jgi:hypothetical protein